MFGVDTSELLILAVLALIFIGPKDLPMAMRTVGRWVAKAQGVARHFRSGLDEMVRQAGGDPSGIQYVELGFPDIPAAVQKGDVAAGQVVEPFLTTGTGQGLKNIGSNYAGVQPSLQVALYFTAVPYMQQNAETVTKFKAAMNKSLSYAQAHPDEARAILTKYTKLDDKTRAALTLPQWNEQINTESVNLLADLGTQDKLFKSKPDVTKLLP